MTPQQIKSKAKNKKSVITVYKFRTSQNEFLTAQAH